MPAAALALYGAVARREAEFPVASLHRTGPLLCLVVQGRSFQDWDEGEGDKALRRRTPARLSISRKIFQTLPLHERDSSCGEALRERPIYRCALRGTRLLLSFSVSLRPGLAFRLAGERDLPGLGWFLAHDKD